MAGDADAGRPLAELLHSRTVHRSLPPAQPGFVIFNPGITCALVARAASSRCLRLSRCSGGCFPYLSPRYTLWALMGQRFSASYRERRWCSERNWAGSGHEPWRQSSLTTPRGHRRQCWECFKALLGGTGLLQRVPAGRSRTTSRFRGQRPRKVEARRPSFSPQERPGRFYDDLQPSSFGRARA